MSRSPGRVILFVNLPIVFPSKFPKLRPDMKSLKLLIFTSFLMLLFAASCNKANVTPSTKTGTTLVIVSDNEPSSEIIVGICGAVRSVNPSMEVQFYQSKAFDIPQGAYLLYYVMLNYPKGTYIAGILEPGVSSKRIVYKADDDFILAPDNMLSTRIFNYSPVSQCYFIDNPAVLQGAQPSTLSFEEFYKRAIISLISGTSLSTFGSVCQNPQKFTVQEPLLWKDTIKGEVLFVDNFGNCTTNIPQSLTSNIPLGTVYKLMSDTTTLSIVLGVNNSSVPTGNNVCFINSSQRLELSINMVNLSEKYHMVANSKVFMKRN